MQSLKGDINHSPSSNYSILRLNKDNLADLASLHSEVYSDGKDVEYFLKKYNTGFAGIEYVGFIAYDETRKPVSYYGVIPCFIQFENKKILSAQSADTMTHPNHRNRGLFIHLSNMTFDLCKEVGIQLIFGFPNQNSYPTMVKRLGWVETEKLSRFALPVNNFWERSFLKPSQPRRERILQNFLLSKQGLGNSIIEDGFGGIYRDTAYFLYKAAAKNYVVRINSSEAWIKINKQLIIGDIKFTGSDEQEFFRDIKHLARQLGLDKISFQASNGCSAHKLFSSSYKAIPSFPVLFKDLGCQVPLNRIKFTFSDIDIF